MRFIEPAGRAATPTRAVAQMTPRECRCRTGDAQLKARFERDATPLLAELYRHAVRITGDRADAEDLLQDALVHAYSGFPTFRQGSNLGAWMHRILVNTHINSYRKRRRQPAQFPVADITDPRVMAGTGRSATGLPSAEDEALDGLPDKRITAAMQAIPEQFRRAVYYADVEGYRYKEIAEIMNTPVGTVISRLHRGRRLLRELLADVAEQRGYELRRLAAS